MNIVTIVGARPQFIKAAPVSNALRKNHSEFLIHTGQHYDENMSRLFFDELGIPAPDVNLEIGSGPHGEQTGRMLVGIEKILLEKKPDLVLVYGDTNSTLAGAIAAAKLQIPVAHVEAGLRSFNRDMPEEINRILTDKISNLLFCPTKTAVDHLHKEGITTGVHQTGDVMYDAALHFAGLADKKESILAKLGLERKHYLLATCHRPQNTDDEQALTGIVEAFIESGETVVFPVHPRTRVFLKKFGLLEKMKQAENIMPIEPVGYLQMLQLEKFAKKILTDSGGVQKEAYFYKVPCITMRPETEWVETVQDGWNILTGSDKQKILHAITGFSPTHEQKNHYGNGKASEKIAEILNAM
ncbi:MAG: UDP-N-acetylglucosamine 2-epimerase (non-hydrolyzing) [Actinobacteria bacterium]|nr:UDP-N-acetylglucosamine 2-epimerase (non-hydrolyzing) [Actinomycetota bacterium]